MPIFGNTLSFANNKLEENSIKWRKQYGDIQTLWLGPDPLVTVHDSPTIYNTFLKDGESYSHRPILRVLNDIKHGRYGVIFTDGPLWREHRRFALKVFRDLGLGKNLMQERILNEITAIICNVKDDLKNNINMISLQGELDRGVGSIINALTFGYRYGRDKQEEFNFVKKFAINIVTNGGHPLMKILDTNLNFLKYFPVFKQFYDKAIRDAKEGEDFFLKKIDEHRQRINFDSDEDSIDYVDAYLKEKHKLEKNGEASHYFSDLQLYGTITDLWIAGQETTSNTLSWLCIYLINRPEIQKKIHEELDTVIRSDRLITVEDKNDLNYVNAVVAETQRYCTLVTLNLFHTTAKDVEIRGYKIPKGTLITHHITTVMKDERYFKDPEVFNPERFLDKNGKFFSPPELMPFGIGKRACLGEGLAKMELFLFTANIFNQMRLRSPNREQICEDKLIGITAMPKPWKCRVEFKY